MSSRLNYNEVTVKMPAGKYFIGDPCYVIGGDEWHEFLEVYWPDRLEFSTSPIFRYKGNLVVVFSTKYGDGVYPGSDGNAYSVDAGLIGMVPYALVAEENNEDLGSVVVFDEPVECKFYDSGTLVFGDVTIETGDEYDEDDEDINFIATSDDIIYAVDKNNQLFTVDRYTGTAVSVQT